MELHKSAVQLLCIDGSSQLEAGATATAATENGVQKIAARGLGISSLRDCIRHRSLRPHRHCQGSQKMPPQLKKSEECGKASQNCEEPHKTKMKISMELKAELKLELKAELKAELEGGERREFGGEHLFQMLFLVLMFTFFVGYVVGSAAQPVWLVINLHRVANSVLSK